MKSAHGIVRMAMPMDDCGLDVGTRETQTAEKSFCATPPVHVQALSLYNCTNFLANDRNLKGSTAVF